MDAGLNYWRILCNVFNNFYPNKNIAFQGVFELTGRLATSFQKSFFI
jgi:hypothetical protein